MVENSAPFDKHALDKELTTLTFVATIQLKQYASGWTGASP